MRTERQIDRSEEPYHLHVSGAEIYKTGQLRTLLGRADGHLCADESAFSHFFPKLSRSLGVEIRTLWNVAYA